MTLEKFADICNNDREDRFEVMSLPELVNGYLQDVWWVRARTGHTIPVCHIFSILVSIVHLCLQGISSKNKRIINMGRLQTVIYRATADEWSKIRALFFLFM